MSDDTALEVPPGSHEILFGRGEHARAFISSQMQSGRKKVYALERARLADAISALPLFQPWLWERDAPVGQYYSEETCVGAAATSEVLILVLGRHLTDITRGEYEAAKAAGANVFIFRDQRTRPTSEVKQFISAERDHATTGTFVDADDLVKQVVSALSRRAVYEMRRGIVARRQPREAPQAPVEDRDAPWSEPPASRAKYEEIRLEIGEDPDRPETFRPVSEVVGELREVAAGGDIGRALDEFHELVFNVYDLGRPDAAAELLAELREIVPPGRANLIDETWLLNTEALILSRLGHEGRAQPLWERMLEVGRRVEDKHLIATALQNLAICAGNAEDWDAAELYAREGIALKLELDEHHGAMQIFNEFILIAIARSDFSLASEFLDDYERLGQAIGDLELLSSAYGNRGNYFVARQDYKAAEVQYRTALKYARKTRDAVRELTALQNMAAVCADQGRNGEGIRWARKGVRLAEQFELPAHIEIFHRALANGLYRAGRPREALREYDRAREAAWANESTDLWAQATVSIGGIYVEIGQPGAAVEPLQRANSVFRELGDFEWEFRAKQNLVVAYEESGELSAAADTAEAAVNLLPRDDHEQRARGLRGAAEMCLGSADLLDRAVELFSSALDEEATFLDSTEIASRAAVTGAFLRDAEADAHALAFFTRAIDGFAGRDPGRELFDSLNDRAIAWAETGESSQAIEDLERAAQVAAQLGDPVLLQRAHLNLGEIQRRAGDPRAAVSTLREAVTQARALDDPETLAWSLDHLALALIDEDLPSEAQTVLAELADVSDEHGLRRWQAEGHSLQGQLAFLSGEYQQAASEYEAAAQAYDYDEPDGLHKVGAWLESLSKAGETDRLEATTQRLIDQAQNGGDPTEAITHLGRSGGSWLARGDVEEAVGLFSAALVLGAVTMDLPGDDAPAEEIDTQAQARSYRPYAVAVGLLRVAIFDCDVDETGVLARLVEFMDQEHNGLGTAMSDLFETTYTTMTETLAAK